MSDNWPDLEDLKQWRDVTGEEWDGQFARELAAAIARVKLDVGLWDEAVDVPDEALGEAAARMAVLIRANAEIPTELLSHDPIYQACLKGHRRRFSIA